MAEIVPYRFARCVGRTRRTAAAALRMAPLVADAHIDLQTRRLGETLAQKGVPSHLVAAEMKAYEAAIRAQMWRIALIGRPA